MFKRRTEYFVVNIIEHGQRQEQSQVQEMEIKEI